MIATFYHWFETRKVKFAQNGINLNIPLKIGLSANSAHADLYSERYEWTIQLWDNGLSDSHFLDWESMDKGVETTHYEFTTEQEMLGFLEATLQRMNPPQV